MFISTFVLLRKSYEIPPIIEYSLQLILNQIPGKFNLRITEHSTQTSSIQRKHNADIS